MARPMSKSRRGRSRTLRRPAVIDLTNFNGLRRFKVAQEKVQVTDRQVDNWQINKRTVGSGVNSLWGKMTDATFGYPGFVNDQIRVVHIDVHFDGRGTSMTGASGSVAFTANPRVCAFMSTFTEAELDTSKISANIGDYGGGATLFNNTKHIRLPVGPAFPIGRFGSDENAGDSRLIVACTGFVGTYRVIVTYETTGWPDSTVQL